jgi:DNA-binding PadR family transcriptional regulator
VGNITNAELAILSLIVEQPRHAYQVEQVIEERNMRYWTEIGFSSIYRILTKMEGAGWLTSQMQPPEGRGPARKVYHLTPEGEHVWQQAALLTLTKPERKYSSFLLGLDSLSALPPEDVKDALSKNLNDLQAIYGQISQAVEKHPLRDDFFIGIFFDYLLNQLENEIKWMQDIIQRLHTHYQSVN